ncbi:hypothetical protein D029_0360A, partial [Vibrio parahaemolyticus 970107]
MLRFTRFCTSNSSS